MQGLKLERLKRTAASMSVDLDSGEGLGLFLVHLRSGSRLDIQGLRTATPKMQLGCE